MVVSASPHATAIGRDVLAEGGTAADAAVAVALTMAVTWPEAGNLGGGGFMMVAEPGQGVVCIDYRETAPASATPTMYGRDDSRFSFKAVGVPGTVRGLAAAHERYGRLPWARLVKPAARLARRGFVVDTHLAESINSVMDQPGVADEPRYAELRRLYGHPDGRAWRAGDHLVLPDLADTLDRIAEQGPDGLYRGPVAERLAEAMAAADGRITTDDLAGYQAVVRPAVHTRFQGYDVYGPPPPSSGGYVVRLVLGMLETFDLDAADRFAPRTVHLTAEALRRGFRDRAAYLGDTDFIDLPDKLDDPGYPARLAQGIDPDAATPSETITGPITLTDESDSTTHFAVVDAAGLAISNTYTLEASWGSRMIAPGTGFLLNNEMGDFNWFPGETTRRGRIGTDANLIAPGKRMLSSMTPVIVQRDGQSILLTGSPGGRTIISTVVNILLSTLAFDIPLPDAVAAPRMHHQWFPDELRIEASDRPGWDELLQTLWRMGHELDVRQSTQGSAHSIAIDPATGRVTGVADWRRGGAAAGLE